MTDSGPFSAGITAPVDELALEVLGIGHQTRRTGRPYTLVLTKTDALFKDDLRRRRREEEDLAWITARRSM